jgi:hypothetical protein
MNISIGSKSKSIEVGWEMDEELEAIRDEDPLYPNWIEYTEYSPIASKLCSLLSPTWQC